MIETTPLMWIGFLALVLGVLGIDLFFVDRKAHRVPLKEALLWSALWIGLAVAFGIGLALWDKAGPAIASKFAAGYILELSLSVDNLFVFIIIFAHFKVPEKLHHKVLFWGILGALVLRAIFIGLGAAAVDRWHWILYFFGAFLVYTGIKLLFHKEEKIDPEQSWIVKLSHRFLRVTKTYQADRFFIRRSGLWWVTPLFIIVLIVEATDVVFAVDSIPAVFGISTDPFIVYTSNIFAILGLRSMFFALEGVMHMFRFLKVGLAIILALIGLKLLFLQWAEAKWGFHAGEFAVLGMIGLILIVSIGMSVFVPQKKKRIKGRK